MKTKYRNNYLLAAITLAGLAFPASSAFATPYYWDIDGDAAAGAGGVSPSGNWEDSGTTWSTDSLGVLATSAYTTLAGDDLFFSAGTDATGSYAVTLGTNQSAKSLTFEEGSVTLSGAGAISLAGGGGLTVDTLAGNATVSTALTANANNTFKVGTGRTLTLDTGTFTRGTRATLNVQGFGTVASSMTGLSTLTNDILGPWASIGTGASTQYATISAGNITGLAGTAAATAADVIDTLGTVNYDVANIGTLGAGASVNTLRYTGAAGTIAGAMTTKGIMNAGTGTLTFSGALTSGAAATELVVNTANSDLTFDGAITGAIVKTGSGTLTMGSGVTNALANQSNMTVNEGVLIANSSNNDVLRGATIHSGGTLRWGANDKIANGQEYIINAGGTLDIQGFDDLINRFNGAGTITGTSGRLQVQGGTSVFTGLISGSGVRLNLQRDGAATVTLSGLNSYGGTTSIQRGTLNINTIANADGTASAIGAPTTGVNGTIAMGSGTFAGKLVYTGAAAQTNRVINLAGGNGGATLEQSGTDLLKFTSSLTSTVKGTKTLTLQGDTAGTGEIGGVIVDNGTVGTTSLAVAYTLAAPTSTITLGSVAGITVGAGISGTGIAGGTTITAINTSTNVVTLSAPTIAAGALNQDMVVTGVTNTTSLAKNGTGTWVLSGNNTYSGATTINGGTLKLSGAGRLGGGNYARAMFIAPGATLTFEQTAPAQTLSGAITGGGSLVLNGSGSGLILSGTGSSYGSLTMTSNVVTGRLFINNAGALPAAATVAIDGGTFVIGAAGTYDAAITAASGVSISARNAATLSNVTLPGSGSVIFNNDDSSTNLLTISNDQTLTGALTVQVGGNKMTTTTAALGAATLSGKLTGGGSLTVTSEGNSGNINGLFRSGVLILEGSNDYTGQTTVNSGTLRINGNQTGANGAVTVGGAPAAGTPTLAGTGTIGGNVTIATAGGGAAGTLAPGSGGVGNLVLNSTTLAFGTGSTASFEVDADTIANRDQVTGISTLTYGGALRITATGTLSAGDSWDLFDFVSQSGTFENNSSFGTDGLSDPDLPDLGPGLGWQFDYTTGTLSVAAIGGSAYDTWKALITNGQDGRTEDADGDGFTNLQEFHFGTSPIAGNGSLVTTSSSGGNLVLRWLQRESGATYTLMQSSTLGTGSWTAAAQTPALDGVQTGAPTDYDYYTVTVPTSGGKLFFRIEGMEN